MIFAKISSFVWGQWYTWKRPEMNGIKQFRHSNKIGWTLYYKTSSICGGINHYFPCNRGRLTEDKKTLTEKDRWTTSEMMFCDMSGRLEDNSLRLVEIQMNLVVWSKWILQYLSLRNSRDKLFQYCETNSETEISLLGTIASEILDEGESEMARPSIWWETLLSEWSGYMLSARQ